MGLQDFLLSSMKKCKHLSSTPVFWSREKKYLNKESSLAHLFFLGKS